MSRRFAHPGQKARSAALTTRCSSEGSRRLIPSGGPSPIDRDGLIAAVLEHTFESRYQQSDVKPVRWLHVGLLQGALETLTDYGNQKALDYDRDTWHAEIAALKSKYGLNYDRDSEAIQPYYVIETMNSIDCYPRPNAC